MTIVKPQGMRRWGKSQAQPGIPSTHILKLENEWNIYEMSKMTNDVEDVWDVEDIRINVISERCWGYPHYRHIRVNMIVLAERRRKAIISRANGGQPHSGLNWYEIEAFIP